MEQGTPQKENLFVKGTLQAFSDAGRSLLKLVKDPIGGQTKALEELGTKQAFNVSILFMLFYVIAIYLFSRSGLDSGVEDVLKGVDPSIPIPKAEAKMSVEQFFKLILFSFVPFITLFLGVFLSTFLSTEKHDVAVSSFVTGMVSVPLGFFFYVLSFVSHDNLPVAFVISIFTVSFAVLLLNASLIELFKLPKRMTMLLIPSIFTLSGFLSYLLYNHFLLS